jgi:HPt (histidine-containing phosphotransfer) domain-containing protein
LNAVLAVPAQDKQHYLPLSDAQKIIIVPNVVKTAFIDSWATERHAIASAFAQTDWTLAVRKLHKTLGALRAIKNDELVVPCERLHHIVAHEKAVTPLSVAASSDFLTQVDEAVERLRREL